MRYLIPRRWYNGFYPMFFLLTCCGAFFAVALPAPGDEAQKQRGNLEDWVSILDGVFTNKSPKQPNTNRRTDAPQASQLSEPADLLAAAATVASEVLGIADQSLPPLDPTVAKSLGRKHREAILKEHGQLLNSPQESSVRQIWKQLLLAAHENQDDFSLTFTKDRTVNAFAFVGKNVVVTSGFLDFAARSKNHHDLIRFVLAHELGHIALHHTDRPFQRIAFADNILEGSGIAPHILTAMIKQTAVNQANETASDCYARTLLLKNRWPIDGGIEFFQRLGELRKPDTTSVVSALFSSHPRDQRRLQLLKTGRGCN